MDSCNSNLLSFAIAFYCIRFGLACQALCGIFEKTQKEEAQGEKVRFFQKNYDCLDLRRLSQDETMSSTKVVKLCSGFQSKALRDLEESP